jgi:hypothetical protein
MDVTAESVAAVFDARAEVRGLRLVYEPKYLRFFQARFESLGACAESHPSRSINIGPHDALPAGSAIRS